MGGAAGGVAGAPAEPEPEPDDAAAKLVLFHAGESGSVARYRLSAGATDLSGALSAGELESLTELAPGEWRLVMEVDGEEHERVLELEAAREFGATLTQSASEAGHRLDVFAIDGELDEGQARLLVLQRSSAFDLQLDVGSDGSTEGAIAPEGLSPAWPIDVTRPALSLMSGQELTHQFTLPRQDAGGTLIAVLMGDPAADGLGPQGLRLLTADVDREQVGEVRPNPQLYLVHASAAHAALDLFVSKGNPQWTPVQPASGKVAAYSPDLSTNAQRSVAELADDVRFGEVRVARVPPGPSTLDLYLSIPADDQLPAPLSMDLVFEPLANQRLRSGGAVGRQGTSHLGDELRPGARYLAFAAATRLWPDNRSRYAPAAPTFPLELLERPLLGAGQLSLMVASSLTKEGTVSGVAGSIALNDQVVLETTGAFGLGPAEVVEAGSVRITLKTASFESVLPLNGVSGQNLLVVAAGDISPPPSLVQPRPWRPDDVDGDGAVASEWDEKTGLFTDPNYLPYDGDSTLSQDDCPAEPGSVSHGGCPSPGPTWLVIDLAQRPPQVVVAPM
jgi:hypothetical protein